MNSKLNMKSRTMILLAGGLFCTSALVACGDDDANNAQPVEHQSAHQALGENLQFAVEDLNQALGYLRTDTKFGIATAVSALDQQSEDCTEPAFPDENGDTFDCVVVEEVRAEEQLQDGADAIIEELNARVFLESNIEEETDTKITYLVSGDTFCTEDEGEDCVADIDALQLRLAVTSPAAGDFNISVMVGEARFNPLDVELHRAKLAAEIDLAELRPTMELMASIDDATLDDLPTLMQGRIRAELAHTATTATATIDIQEKIIASGNDWSVKIDPAAPAARFSVDSGTNMLQALLALKPVEIQAPVSETEVVWDSEGGETETTTEYDILAQVAGASFTLDYLVGEDRVEINNIGLGAAQSTLDIDGHRVLEVDLNANDGRAMNLEIEAIGDEGAKITMTPGMDLALMIKLMEVQQHFNDIQDWMLDDMINIAFNGAAAPKLRIEDGEVEVLEGTLSMSSTAANIDVEIAAGQCIIDDNASPSVGGGIEGGGIEGEIGADGEMEEGAHPMSGISAGTCG